MKLQKQAYKNHLCDNCAGEIQKGTHYYHDQFWKKQSYDNEFDIITKAHMVIWRTHINCRLQNIAKP